MSGWNYRVIVTKTDDAFAGVDMSVHEVYYSKDGIPDSWTMEPVNFGGESVEEVARALTQAAADVLAQSPLIEKDGILVEYEGPGA
jgi:hypothetical protein